MAFSNARELLMPIQCPFDGDSFDFWEGLETSHGTAKA